MSDFADSSPIPAKPSPPRRIEYLAAVRFPFSHPDWLKSTLILGVFLLIPVLSLLLEFGYAYEITERKHRGKDATYLPFDMNRFSEYITRGVWPFLVFFIAQTIGAVIYQIVFQGTMFGSMAIYQADNETGTIILAVLIPVVVIGFFTFLMLLALVVRPLMLRAGLSQDFGQTVKFKWLGDFLKRMWVEVLLLNLFTVLVGGFFNLLGVMACCVGMLFTSALVCIMGAHLDWQLYELYLARGGEPIPLKPLPADVPPVVLPTPGPPG